MSSNPRRKSINTLALGADVEVLELWTKDDFDDWGKSDPEDLSANGKPTIPPADGGNKAILFMVSAFTIEAIMWGLPLSSAGVFTAYYQSQPAFLNGRFLPVVGTLATGIPFLGAPIITPLTAKYHQYQRHMIWGGWIMCIFSLIAASYSTQTWHLIITQGFAYGVGFLVLYYAVLSMLNEWFVKRRGLAYGILFAAAGISGTVLPFLLEALLLKYGFRVTLRGYAIAMFVLIGPTLPFCVGRMPTSVSPVNPKINYRQLLKNPVLYALSFSNLFQGLAFYLPGLYLALYATSFSITPIHATLLLCLLNLAQVIGQLALGWVSDWSNVFALLTGSTIGSAIVACVLWYTATGLNYLIPFSIFYGLFAGGYTVLYPRFVDSMTTDSKTGLWLYGILAFQRGLGNVLAGPISAALLKFLDTKSTNGDSAHAYRQLIIFVGAAFIASSLGGIGYFVSDRRTNK